MNFKSNNLLIAEEAIERVPSMLYKRARNKGPIETNRPTDIILLNGMQ